MESATWELAAEVDDLRLAIEQIDKAKDEEQDALRCGDLTRVAELRHVLLPDLERRLQALNDKLRRAR